MSNVIYIHDWLAERNRRCPLCESYDYDFVWTGSESNFVWTCWDCGYEDLTDPKDF